MDIFLFAKILIVLNHMKKDKNTDFYIPSPQLERMKDAGDEEAQKQMGITLCIETINKIKNMKGLKGIHIISGGKEDMVPAIVSGAGL